TPERFHALNEETAERWPRTMLATSTHDTKRSEDVRARISLLSEIPDRWAAAVRRWRDMNETHRRNRMPDRNAEYLLYQTLVGAWPLETERAVAYMEKASKEAKAFTSWTDPDPEYDQALAGFVAAILSDVPFRQEVESFAEPLKESGWVSSLAQQLLKLTCPGVPDIYQGTELWDLSLVDPDNRRPVDYSARRALLGELPGLSPEEIWRSAATGLPKLHVTQRALHLRRERPHAFGPVGDYVPLYASGARRDHVIAFSRGGEVITVVPRFVLKLGGDWADTQVMLPEGEWHNVLTGESVTSHPLPMGSLLGRFPVALLATSAS
ncbi:MAG: malto-oligosyltrehalose synthase, partial [Actinomycetota bacterium]|nr:malto-oligosyltrehalose synthase [Actinomycetota bacterium]